MSKLWLLLLLLAVLYLVHDCEARRNRGRNRDRDPAATGVGQGRRGGRHGGGPNRRGPHRGGRNRGRGGRGRGRPGRGNRQRPNRCQPAASERIAPVTQSLLSSASGSFSVNIYRELAQGQPNVVVSPFSIYTALSMTSIGARRETLTELRATIGPQRMRPRRVHQGMSALLSSQSRGLTGNVTWSSANAAYVREEMRLKPSFPCKLRKMYRAEVNTFQMNHPEGPEKPINDWVAEKTGGQIQDFLQSGTIRSNTALWLLNAVYFKGSWKTPFQVSSTRQQPFRINNADQVMVDMMFLNSNFASKRVDDLQAHVLELPYTGDRVSLFVILPEDVEGLAFLESNLTPERLEYAVTNMNQPVEMDLNLPKMKIGFESELKAALQRLGIRKLFSESEADLSGIAMGDNLYVSDAKHKAVLEINEEGTVAAAVTGIGISLTSLPPQFRVDHPFMFVLRDKTTNTNLFIGKYSDPRRAM